MSTYQFLKGLNQKIPNKVVKQEYNRIYRNLKRSVYGYVKKGVTTSFFKLPSKPKKITEASLRRLQKSVVEWKYYTGQRLTEEEYKSLPSNISRSFQHNIKELNRRANKQSKLSKDVEDAIKKYREELDQQVRDKNKDNPDYQKMLEEGYDIDYIPDVVTNEAINLYNMAETAYSEATGELAKGNHNRNWWLVQLKAETALEAFADAGVREYSRLFSFNIRHSNREYADIVDTFDAALYDSDQLDKDERFSNIMSLMTGNPKNLTARERREYDDIRESLGLT